VSPAIDVAGGERLTGTVVEHDRLSGNCRVEINRGAIRRVDDRLTQGSGARIVGIRAQAV
jgi:hypothetical protein